MDEKDEEFEFTSFFLQYEKLGAFVSDEPVSLNKMTSCYEGEFDPNIPEEGPTSPPPGWLDCVTGYVEPKGEDQLYPPPPAYNPQPENDRNASVPIFRVPTVSEDIAREALLKFVASKWCYSSKPARNLVFKNLKPLTVYRYRLETYTETRSSTWECQPFNGGQDVDGPHYGMSPAPWDIPVIMPQRYTDEVQKICVPHSSVVKPCHQCQGFGRVRCKSCQGSGSVKTLYNLPRDQARQKQTLWKLSREGQKKVYILSWKRQQKLPILCWQKYLLNYIQLTVTWKNHVFEFIPDRLPEFPLKNFEKVTADPFFVDENPLVYPIVGFPDQDICEQSRIATQEHFRKFSSVSRILQQRQSIELVPLTHAFSTYNGKDFEYFVYGLENKIYTAKYPSACTIL